MIGVGRSMALALAASTMFGGFAHDIPLSVAYPVGQAPRRSWRRSGETYQPNGKREVARRLRQIQNGQLKVSV